MPAPKAPAPLPGYQRVNTLDAQSRTAIDANLRHRDPSSSADVEAFALAHRLALRVHEITQTFPDPLQHLTAQLRSAAIDLPALLAESAAHDDPAERRAALAAARRRAHVASYHLLLARDLGHLTAIQYGRLRTDYLRVAHLLTRLRRAD